MNTNFHASREEKACGKEFKGSVGTREPLRLLCSSILDREVMQAHRGFASSGIREGISSV
jgi:hypothetical protein